MTRIAAALALVLSLSLAAVALAESDRTVTFDETTTKLDWEATGSGGGAPGPVAFQPTECDQPGHDCDYTLVRVNVTGTMSTTITPDAGVDVDLYVFKSDSKGTDGGAEVGHSSAILDTPEEFSSKVTPGWYLIRVDFYTAANGKFVGKTIFKPTPPEVPAPGTTPTPAPGPAVNAPPTSKVTKAGKAGFAGTAADDTGVARVEVGVLMKAGRKCKQLTKSGFKPVAKCGQPTAFLAATGTSKWAFKFKKPLKKGSYQLFSRAIDTGGATQSGFAKPKSLKVKR